MRWVGVVKLPAVSLYRVKVGRPREWEN